jgi:hypothetical protein
MKSLPVIVLIITLSLSVYAQTNESPAGAYQWKRGKTELQPGYVVLKSGKRMDGKISLIGSAELVKEVNPKPQTPNPLNFYLLNKS